MSRPRSPLFAFRAAGRIGDGLVHYTRHGQSIVRERVTPADPQTAAQLSNRQTWRNGADFWQDLDASEKQAYADLAGQISTNRGWSNFISLWMRGLVSYERGEGHISILPFSKGTPGAGTWAITIQAAQFLGGFLLNTSSNDGDNIPFEVFLDAGTYTLALLTSTDDNRGILDLDIDGGEVASFDCYSLGAVVLNVIKDQAGIVITTPGLKTITARVDGQNPAANDFFATISGIALWRTS